MAKKPIFVTRPSLPPLDEFLPYLREIWDSRWLTNNGPFHKKLEVALQEFLQVDHVVLCSNGTSALLLALRALELKGEVITTPYSFVATAHAIVWAGLEPVFVDIDPETFNLNPEYLETAITENTAAIMPVHCYGNPCRVDKIEAIAKAHNLPVIYDAAHAFGVDDEKGSLLQYGDLSVLSFHATKVFNTFEGGAIICHDENMRKRLEYLRNFGFEDETHVPEIGINAKLNEFQAALGLLQLDHINSWFLQREALAQRYQNLLGSVAGIDCSYLSEASKPNYAYFPIRIKSTYPLSRDQVVKRLGEYDVYVRRYFYPLITDFSLYKQSICIPDNLTKARSVANTVICLPIYPDLTIDEVEKICQLLKGWAYE